MCDCFHLAFPNWHAASGTGASRRLRGPEAPGEDDSVCDESSQYAEERPRPQGSSPVEEFPEKYTDSDKECEGEHDLQYKSGSGKKTRKSGLGSMFDKRSTPKMSKLKEAPSHESEVIVKTAKDGCAEGLVYGGGGKDGIFIKQVVPESPASKSLELKEGDRILSATVYFDNMSYEDAIQILEHAQAYKVKLCLKRQPEAAEPVIESDIIPEEELDTLEMREQGKVKRRGDARISWPKFTSFGKGRKSPFTRSHSSSEADEQRKLELSPTTSDTESPIKSQDALKGKKRHKIKLPVLKKGRRTSSPEEQCLESPSEETPEYYVADDLKAGEDLNLDRKLTEPQTVEQKVELISMKTTDVTVALADKGSSSGLKSPDGKKKKKERSEFKIKILGKDKSHKKDAKAKSPKRLKTLGGSIETSDQPEKEKSFAIPSCESQTKLVDVSAGVISSENSGLPSAISVTPEMEISVPKVELGVDVPFMRKSPQKAMENKQNQETKTGFKLPKVGLGDISIEETIREMKVSVDEGPSKMEQHEGPKVKDPYEQLSFRTQLPKREEIEIPGMEDMSLRSTVAGIKNPKARFMGQYEELQSETVQMSIDVDSVKEAVSKLPGYKLPKVDTSGVLIPEEITVIDANAQRISVKTPTKVVDTKPKHDMASFKLPKITADYLTSEELLVEAKLDDMKIKEYKTKMIKTEVYRREDIVIPGKDSAQEVAIIRAEDTEGAHGRDGHSPKQSDKKSRKAKLTTIGFGVAKPDIKIPDVGIHLPKQKGGAAKEEGTIFIQKVTTGSGKDKEQIRGVLSDVKIPNIDGMEFIDSADDLSVRTNDKGISIDGVEEKTFDGERTSSKFKMPNINISMPMVKGPKFDSSLSNKDVDVALPEVKAEVKLPEVPAVDFTLGKVDGSIPEGTMEVEKPELEVKYLNYDEYGGLGGKFKMPKFGITLPKLKGPDHGLGFLKKDKDKPEVKADIRHQEVPSISVDVQPSPGQIDVQGGMFKMPKYGITLPKVKGPEIDFSSSMKNIDVTLPEAKVEVKLPVGELKEHSLEMSSTQLEASGDDSGKGLGKDFKIDQEVNIEGPTGLITGTEREGKDKKFKVPHLDLSMPKVKGPKIDFSISKNKMEATLPEAKADVTLPKVGRGEVNVSVPYTEIEVPDAKVGVKPKDGQVEMKPTEYGAEMAEHVGKFKMPKFGIKMPKIKGPEFDVSLQKTDVTIQQTMVEVKVPDKPEMEVIIGTAELSIPEEPAEYEIPELEMKLLKGEVEAHGGKFKLPKFGKAKTKIKGPDLHLGFSKKDVDEIQLPEVELNEPSVDLQVKTPEIKVTKKGKEGSPSRFKMPTLKLPKFGLSASSSTVEVPNLDKDVRINEAEIEVPEEVLKVDIQAPRIDYETPSVHMKTTGSEQDGKGSKFKMPRFSFSMPQVKQPDFDLSSSKKDIDLTLPAVKAEVQLPGVELREPSAGLEIKAPQIMIAAEDMEEPALEFKIPILNMPKFGILTPTASVEVPDLDKDVKIPEEGLKVDIETPSIDTEGPSVHMKTTGMENEGKGSKFKMPSLRFSMPHLKGPDIDLSLSKKDVDVTLPEAKAEITLPDVELNEPSAELEIKAPKLKVTTKSKEDSPSKFKMPTLKLPKFGLGSSSATVEVPNLDKDVKIDGADIEVPEELLRVDIEAPRIDYEAPSVHMKTTGSEQDGKGSKFKMPSFSFSMPQVKQPDFDLSLSKKDIDVTLPAVKAEVQLPGAELREPSAGLEIKAPQIMIAAENKEEPPLEFKIPTLNMPKFGILTPTASVEVPDLDKDVKMHGIDIKIPEEGLKVDIETPSIDTEGPTVHMKTTGMEHEGKGSKFKMPSLRFSMPHLKGPDVDLSLSNKDVDVTIPEAKAEIKLPDVELKEPSAEVEIKAPELKVTTKGKEESPSKFKMPTLKFPKFGLGSSSATVEVPNLDKDVKIDGAGIEVPEEVLRVDIEAPRIDYEAPSVQMKTTGSEREGKGSKFKMPSFSFSMPQVKQPDIDFNLSKKDIDLTLPAAKAEIQLPGVELREPSAGLEIKAPQIMIAAENKEEPPLEFKIPTLNMPKFGILTPTASVEVPDLDKDVKIPEEGLKVDIETPSIDTEGPSVHMKTTGMENEGKGSKFKMPSLRFSMPHLKGPDIDLSLSKKDVDVTLPEAKAEITLPDVELNEPSAELEIKAPKLKVTTKSKEESPSKFKMPTLKLPKFGLGSSSATVEVPNLDKDVKIDGADIEVPEELLRVDIEAPRIDYEAPSVHMKTTGSEQDGKGSKFKMPSFSFSMPQVKQPDFDLSSSKKDIDVTLPAVKAEIQLPGVELREPSAGLEIKAPQIMIAAEDMEEPALEFKIPILNMPKFGILTPTASVEVPDLDKDVTMHGIDIKIPEEGLKVDIETPSIDTEGPSVHMKTTGMEHEGKGSKFKMPSLRFSMPHLKGPDIDLTLSKKNVDVTLPEAKAEIKLPDVELKEPSAEVEIKAPELKITTMGKEESPSKFKMPTLKFPKFGLGSSSATVEVPNLDKDVKIDGADIEVPEEVLKLDIEAPRIDYEAPSVQMKTTGSEQDRKGSKFKMPSFSFSMPQVKQPDFDLSLSKKDIDVTLPAVKAEVQLPGVELREPSAGLEIKAPQIMIAAENTEEPPLEFKIPILNMPKFGILTPAASVEVSSSDKDFKMHGTDIKIPDVELKEPSADVEIKAPKLKVTTKSKEGSPSKFKMPTLKFPKFGLSTSSATVEVPNLDKDVRIEGADIEVPEELLRVDIEAPRIDYEAPSVQMKTTGSEQDRKGSKFKMPSFSFSMPQVKQHNFDLSLSKKDIDVTLPAVKAEVQLPGVELKKPSAELEIKAPQMMIAANNMEESSLDFKIPTLNMPKFGILTPTASVEVPDLDKDVKMHGIDIKIPEEGLKVDIETPSIDTEGPSVHMKTTGMEHEGKGSKFKMPSLRFSMPHLKGPDVDLTLSKKDVDVTLPEAKAEIKLPDVELNEPSAELEIKAPELKVTTKSKEGSPSKFKMPTLKFPKFGLSTPIAAVEVTNLDKDVRIDGVDIEVPEEGLRVDIEAPKIDYEAPSVHIKTTGSEREGKGSKFKMPSFSFSMPQVKQPDFDLSLSKKDLDVTLPAGKAEVQLPGVELKKPSAELEIKAPQIMIAAKNMEESSLDFKIPTLNMPKFGILTPAASVEVPDLDKDVKMHGMDIKIPEEGLIVDIETPSIDTEGPSANMKTTGMEHEGKGSKFKMPSLRFSMPHLKGPDFDLSLSKKDVDVTLSEAKAEIKLPDVELKEPSAESEIKAPELKVTTKGKEESPSKFKMPTLKFPKFGSGSPSAKAEVPDMDKYIKTDGAEIRIHQDVLTLDIEAPKIDSEGPSVHVETTESEHERKGSKFQMPRLSFSLPQVKPDVDFSLTKKDVDAKEAKAEIKLPYVELKEPSAEVEIKAPEIKISTKNKEESPSKFKMPTLKFPKFGLGTTSAKAEVPDMDKDAEMDGADIKIPERVLRVDIEAPTIDSEGLSVNLKPTDTEHEGKGSKFKMPSLSFSLPQVIGPDVDFSIPKEEVDATLPLAEAEVKLPDVDLEKPSAEVEIKAPQVKVTTKSTEGSASKFKMPTLKFPKFGLGTTSATVEVPDMEKDADISGADIRIPEKNVRVDIEAPSIDTDGSTVQLKDTESEHEGKGSKFQMPNFSFSMPQVKRPDIDLSLSRKDADMTLPEAKAEVEVKEPEVTISVPDAPSVEVETKMKQTNWTFPKFSISRTGDKIPDVDVNLETPKVVVTSPEAKAEIVIPDVGGSISMGDAPAAELDANLKKSKFSLPKFSFSKSSTKEAEVSAEKPHVDVSLQEGEVKVKQPVLDLKPSEGDVEIDVQESKFKMPRFGITLSKVKGPETVPEAKGEVSTKVEVISPVIEVQASYTEGSPSKFKMPTLTFPKFGAATAKANVEVPDGDKDVEGANLEVSKKGAPSTGTDSPSVDVEVKESQAEGSESRFKLPNFSISTTKVKGPEKQPEGTISLPDAPNVDVEATSKQPNWTFPKFSFSRTSGTTPDVKLETPKVDITSPEAKAEVSLPSVEVQESSGAELDANVNKTKFSLPKFSFSKSNVKAPEITSEFSHVDVSFPEGEIHVSLPEGEVIVRQPEMEIGAPGHKAEHGPILDINLDESTANLTDTEMPKAEGVSAGLGSPSNFKLPVLKMPKLSFSRQKQEEENALVVTECKEDQPEKVAEQQGGSKSPKMSLTSFGEIFKNLDVELNAPKTELETSQEFDTTESCNKKSDPEGPTKSLEKTGWFKFPKFELSSPSEPAKISEKDKPKKEKSPDADAVDEETSFTYSVQSSDAFADISSAMTSERVGLSLPSPTMVTVKYSDSNVPTGFEEMYSNILTSTTTTEQISVEPNLPEKITILSSGFSSSSEETLRLESGKIHVITSNIRANPEAQHAHLLTATQIQSSRGLPLKSGADEATSWTTQDSQSGKRTIYERHMVRESSSERSESKETVVITKQITRIGMLDPSESISEETASSIQRLRDTMHSEKMRFFDGAEK